MSVVIDGKNSKEASKLISEKLKKDKSKGSLSKHFGKMKRNIDGLKYQMALRENED